MKQNRNNSILDKLPVFCTVLGGVLILAIILCGLGNGSEIKDIIKLCVFTGVVIMLLGLYFSIFDDSVKINLHSPDLSTDSIRTREANIRKMPYFNIIFITDFFLAILFIVLVDKRIPHSLILLGGLIIALLFDTYLGIFFTNLLIAYAGIAEVINMNYLIYLIILGTLLCLMAPSIKKINIIPPVLIIILSIQIILLIINNNFGVDKTYYVKVVNEILVTLMVVLGATFIFMLYEFFLDKHTNKPLITEKSKEYTVSDILLEDFSLRMKLKMTAPKIYEHALIVSEVSGQAAKRVGLNEHLAKAGGMYHEIGRLDDGDYVKDGLKYATEYHLPKEVIHIIKSHNLKYAKPASPEGAVVNLTISVLSAKDFLRRNWEETRHRDEADLNKLINKAIEELFAMRLSKNSLDESGLTIKQFHELKEFFLNL